MDLISKLTEWLGISTLYKNIFNRFFDYSLEKDIEKKNKYKGYPTSTTKFLDNLSKRTGIPFVDHNKGDYTFEPLINYIMQMLNLYKTPFHKYLLKVNMKLFGGFLNATRLRDQKRLLDSYLEYEAKYENISIIENLIPQKHNYYIKKILHQYKMEAVEKAHGFKYFITSNKDYFKEIEIFFTVEERTVVDSTRDASSELETMIGSSMRKQLMNANFIYTAFDIVLFVIMFHKVLIPQILDNFEVGIESFSTAVRMVDRFAVFLLTRWFVYIPIMFLIYQVLKSEMIKIFIDYIKIKIPYIDSYVIGDELLKFLKTYENIMGNAPPRDVFVYAYERLDNTYLKHILYKNINEQSTDISNTGKPVSEILAEVPYIPQEYIDILRQAYLTGRPQEGLENVIALLEPRIEKISKDLNKYILIGTFVGSLLLTVILTALIYKDAMNIVEISDQQFIDELRR